MPSNRQQAKTTVSVHNREPSRGGETTTVGAPDRLSSSNPRPRRTTLPVERQQQLLNIFRDRLIPQCNPDLILRIQDVKGYLFNRDFKTAFGDKVYRDAYAVRWSPSRALAYLDILHKLHPFLPDLPLSWCPDGDVGREKQSDGPKEEASLTAQEATIVGGPNLHRSLRDAARIVCLGGGAGAELVALAAYLHHINLPDSRAAESRHPVKFQVEIVDMADWSMTTLELEKGMVEHPVLSPYASAVLKANNAPLVEPERLNVRFIQQDLLYLDSSVAEKIFDRVQLVTLLFTLNELYNTSIAKTTKLLLMMTSILPPDSVLLVVDSPGSYSTISLGNDANDAAADAPPQKKYPMQWLLDHTILETATTRHQTTQVRQPKWEKLFSTESSWFRLPDALQYPIQLEHMRYQAHLYRRLP